MFSYLLLFFQLQSFFGKKIFELVKEKGVLEEYFECLDDVMGFWDEVEKNDIEFIFVRLSFEVRVEVLCKF